MSSPYFSRVWLLKLPCEGFTRRIADLILCFAVIGYTDEAYRLLSNLNEYGTSPSVNLNLRPLWFLWDKLGTWPEGEKAKVYNKVQEDRNSKNMVPDAEPVRKSARLNKGSKFEVPDRDVEQILEDLAQEYRERWWYPAKKYGKPSPHQAGAFSEQEKRRIANVAWQARKGKDDSEFAASQTGAIAMDASSALVSTLDLILSTARIIEDDPKTDSPSSEDILAEIAHYMISNRQIETLAKSRRAWNLLKDRALAKVLQLDDEKVCQFAQRIEDILEERSEHGRILPEDRPLRDLLKKIESNGLAYAKSEKGYLRDDYKESYFSDPATEAEIAEAEEDLNVELPEDYKDFLRITNGFGNPFNGWEYLPAIGSVAELRRITDDEDYFTDLPFDPFEDCTIFPSDIKVGKPFELGTFDIFSIWLIPPSKTSEYKDAMRKLLQDKSGNVNEARKKRVRQRMQGLAGSEQAFWDMQWMCCVWAAGGSACMDYYPSFQAYLAAMAEEGTEYRGKYRWDKMEWWGYAFVKDGDESTAE